MRAGKSSGANEVVLKIGSDPVTCFVRIPGAAGKIREFLAAVSPSSTYCVMRRGDAARLGLASIHFHPLYPGTGTVETVGSLEALAQHEVVDIPEMQLGSLRASHVATMLVDLPELTSIDVVLGRTFFADKKVTIDYPRKLMTIRETRDPREQIPSAQGRTQA